MKTRTFRIAIVSATLAALGVPLIAQVGGGSAPDPAATPATQPAGVAADTVVLTVGDETITAAEFNAFVSELPPQAQMMAAGPGKRLVADQIVQFKLLAQEAEKRNLQDDPAYQRRLNLMRQQLLVGQLIESVQQSVSDADLQAAYEQSKDRFQQVKARHILIRTPDSPVPAQEGKPQLTDEQALAKAKELRERIVAGEDFATVAKAESVDVGSGARGGDLGTFGRGQMVPPFEQAAFSLKPGEISEPVKSPFGYHLIQVQEKVDPQLDEVRDALQQQAAEQRVEKLLNDVRTNTKVELNDAFFGPDNQQPMLPPGMMGQ